MRSRAHFRGDPIHPAVVHFPIAFLLGGASADLLDLVWTAPSWWPVLSYVLIAGGVVTALIAAVPGFIDYVFTIPPASSAKRRATWHMALNLTAVALFALAWFLRGHPEIPPEPVLTGVEAAGAVLVMISGALGGRLMSKNHIGVDTKYAANGRWSEVRIARSGDVVGRVGELEPDQMKLVRLSGRRIVLARTEDGYVAFDDRCTHRGASFAGGVMICGTVQCPWHGSQFDVRTGEVRCGPAAEPISVYRVEDDDGTLRLHVG